MIGQSAKDLSIGRWLSILQNLGIPSDHLKNAHGPCPICAKVGAFSNKKPFRFDDKKGMGTWICTHCGSGSGFDLLMSYHGWDFATAAKEVENVIGVCPVMETKTEAKDVEKIKANIKRIWGEAKFPNVVDDYLRSRGLDIASTALRGHQFLSYRDENGNISKEKAMLALVQDKDGKVTTLHRTFLLANGQRVKKLYQTVQDTWLGGAIRLFPYHEESGFVALAEGIETALAVTEYKKIPTWATVTAQGMERWEPPEFIKRVSIFGDADANYIGQKAAYTLANRLTKAGIQTEVHVPKTGDYLDFLHYMKRRDAA
jgi:putative DNA primase/helicase